MIQIMTASAGSGKTHNLAKEYIRLLFQDGTPDAFRHILAVTFTNKATDEMKSRIISELYTLMKTPEKSRLLGDFYPGMFTEISTLQKAAGIHLRAILNDYSSFSVSTIDRFFQQTLRAFSREIGQFSSYQVALDRGDLAVEAVDRILDSLTDKDSALIQWLGDFVRDELSSGNKYNIDSRLSAIAKGLISTGYTSAIRHAGIDEKKVYSKDNLKKIRSAVKSAISGFEKEVMASAKAIADVFSEEGIDPSVTLRSFAARVIDGYSDIKPGAEIKPPTQSVCDSLSDSGKWFKKADQHLRSRLEGRLEGPASTFVSLFSGRKYRLWQTARLIESQLYSLGIAADLSREFGLLQQDKNVITLDDSTKILHDIIDGSDAPFIYEKTGVRYEHFLLDEFQDTSEVQWENFLPLIRNSDAEGSDNLVVGDVKQSIYRWRGSDWHLMAEQLPREFPLSRNIPLGGNWRTLREIVLFNNSFFEYAAGALDGKLLSEYGINGGLTEIYGNVAQEVCVSDPAPGRVEAVFTPEKDEEMDEILSTISTVLEQGGNWGDIAILTRRNDVGSEIACRLISEGIPVISDDALMIKSSVTVRRLISQFSIVGAPSDSDAASVASYIAGSMDISVPEGYHSLVELAEIILRALREADPDVFSAEIPYILAFQDYLSEWVSVNGNNLALFLKEWEEDNKACVSPPESGSFVRIMSVHKAKGLEFPVVIVPYVEGIELFRQEKGAWCVPDVKGTDLEGIAEAAFQVTLSGKSKDTLFADDYLREVRLQYIDNLNVLYVALTRPRKYLKIIGYTEKNGKISNMADLLEQYISGEGSGFEESDGRYVKGEPYDFSAMKRDEGPAREILSDYPSFVPGERLALRSDAFDFFTEGAQPGYEASERLRGKVLHDILSRVRVASDLEKAVQAACLSGELPESERDEVTAMLSERIASRPEWFCGDGEGILNEVALFDGAGGVRRPDRVIVRDGRVTVIDYKFGAREDEKYSRQVGGYVRIFRKMGYKDVSGFIWYVKEGYVLQIC